MGYKEPLRQARELLLMEIGDLRTQLGKKEYELRRLDSFLKESDQERSHTVSLTKQIVAVLYVLAQQSSDGVPARAVVQEFVRERDDVNESTIRSTLYQVTRKIRPTEIMVDDQTKQVRVLKNGPLYGVEIVAPQ